MVASRLNYLTVEGTEACFRCFPSFLISRDFVPIDNDMRHLQPALRQRFALQDRLRGRVNGKICLREEIP